MRATYFFVLLLMAGMAQAQFSSRLSESEWVDSVFNSLSKDQKIAQLMIIRAHSDKGDEYAEKVAAIIRQYNVGGLCFFQGGPVRQANYTNYYQSIARTPLLVTIDGEWGVGMRLDSVIKFPYQLTLGALSDTMLVYQMGIAVGEQCKRLGIHVNYAPVVDINNNPNNPVIGYRSFGEDKYKVARLGVAYMRGMQDAGIMACAKHFPGHGDVDVDSHYDLPIVNKTRGQLDSMELMPFKALLNAGVGSVMVAHLSIPSLDASPNVATSISAPAVNGLLRNDLGFAGLTFTDALEMKGVAKYFPGGTIAVEALVAGNDMLCLPEDVPEAIKAIKTAIKKKKLNWAILDEKVKKALRAKYQLGLPNQSLIDTHNLTADLNKQTDKIREAVARATITLVRSETGILPVLRDKKVAFVGIGLSNLNAFGTRIQLDHQADTYLFSYKESADKAKDILASLQKGQYQEVVIGVHGFSLRPANQYNISNAALEFYRQLQAFPSVTLVFGNVLSLSYFAEAKNLVACYQDDDITANAAADLLKGRITPQGVLPVSVAGKKFGEGIVYHKQSISLHSPSMPLMERIDSIVNDAMSRKAFPGCVILAARDGAIFYQKAFGQIGYLGERNMNVNDVFDLASVTKVSATTLAVMKLYDQGKLDLDKTLGDYLDMVKGTDKANLKLRDVLLHRAGLVPFIPFYKEVIDTVTGIPSPVYFSKESTGAFTVRVAENLYMRRDYQDTMFQRILKSPLGPRGKYVYSDNDFIFLGKVVEAISGKPLDVYVRQEFYEKMGLLSLGFKPRMKYPLDQIIPTETELHFRKQEIRGDVHDEGASMFGGVAGHAGLFSDAYDLATLYQMLLNGGELNGKRYLSEKTIKLFTAYGSHDSRRGLGFDKPERELKKGQEPYPSVLASPATFGHTGFTGTCVWVDPEKKIVYVFLSNRVNPTRNNRMLLDLNVRGKVQDVLFNLGMW